MLARSPTDHVLDMCAAPGSKAEQILQLMMLRQARANNGESSRTRNGVVSGMVVANDADAKRVHAMCDRLYKRGGRGGKKARDIYCSGSC